MNTRVFALAIVVSLSMAAVSQGIDLPEKWVFSDVNFLNDKEVDSFLAVMKTAKEAGANCMNLKDPQFAFMEMCPKSYHDNVARVKKAADELGLKIVPTIFPFGYSGGYIVQDMNLAAGLPVRNALFVVKNGVATPDPAGAPDLENLGFEEARRNVFPGWTTQDHPGLCSFADTEVKHSGQSSLKITALDKLPEGDRRRGRQCRLTQRVNTKPFQYYHVTLWIKTDGIQAEGEDYLVVTSADGKRRLSYTNIKAQATQDWTMHSVTFNTMESTSIDFSVGASGGRGGTIWFDDVSVEPAGLSNLLRSQTKPFRVTSRYGTVVYEEGKDFEPVKDPNLGKEALELTYYFPFPSWVWHKGPDIVLTKDSRISEGDKIAVSYFHPVLIYNDQITVSMEDPKVFDLMDKQMKNVHEAFHASGYVMNYDEIRILGWEEQADGAKLSPGQILSQHIAKGVEIVKKYAPGATTYTWSDMFDPRHNARRIDGPGYYLCNGDFSGSWLGLPSEVVIMNWGGTGEWFAKRGHKQMLAAYYDQDAVQSVNRWLGRTYKLGNVVGMSYTTWQKKYDDIPAFFKAIQDWDPATAQQVPERRHWEE